MNQGLIQKEKPEQIPEVEILNKEDRIFKAWGSVEVKDKDGDLLPMDEFRKIMPIIMKRGGALMDTHTNRTIGKILNYEFREKQTEDGTAEGVYLTCQVHQDFDLDDQIWKGIKDGDYQGLSFGGRNKFEEIKFEKGMDMTKVLTGLEGFEFSVVPSMANQEATMDQVNFLAKAEIKKEDGETSEALDHYHLYRTDDSGNGETKGTLPREYPEHRHQIVDGVVQEEGDHSHKLTRVLVEKQRIEKGFAGFKDFADCVSQNQDKNNPDAFCGFLQNQVEKAEKEYSVDEEEKSKQTKKSSTLPSGSENAENFIKNKDSNILMTDNKKIGEEEMAPAAPVETTSLDEIKSLLLQLIERVSPVAKEGHKDEDEEDKEKKKVDHEDEDDDKEKKKADVEKDVNPETSGEKVQLPQTTDEVIQEQEPAEGAESDEVKFVEKVKTEVNKEITKVRQELGLSKESTPRLATDREVTKSQSNKAPTNFREANALVRKLEIRR